MIAKVSAMERSSSTIRIRCRDGEEACMVPVVSTFRKMFCDAATLENL
jgi:hypothetical protein